MRIQKKPKILDVTLRDGGYRNKFHFSLDTCQMVTGGLSAAGIDFIEIGYRNGSLKPSPQDGITGLTSDAYIKALVQANPGAQLAVMVHPKNISSSDLLALRDQGVRMVRVCIPSDNVAAGIKVLEEARSLGMLTSANITRATNLPRIRLLEIVEALNASPPDYLYIADSNGNMTPLLVKEIFYLLREVTDIPLGFHAHDNLSLALANSLAALECGAEIIDASLCGMGKGAGNLATETFAAVLKSQYPAHNGHLQLGQIFRCAEELASSEKDVRVLLQPLDLLMGAYNLSMDYTPQIRELEESTDLSPYEIIRIAGENRVPASEMHSGNPLFRCCTSRARVAAGE